ncbi:MAG: CDP-glucose 4,6-dehydratase [Gaiellales bacterium]|nr:CDP-glucose 4,6-dehydratase [Gaiellales bacterium]
MSAARGGAQPDPAFWQGRRVLLTGHTGFKGSWLTCWLQALGAEVMGVSLPELPTEPSLWEQLDVRDVEDVRADIRSDAWLGPARAFAPSIVLHLAAQPLVSTGYEQPALTYEVNVQGTVRVLDFAGSVTGVDATLVITTDKVYDPSQQPPHDETHSLGGREPYSASKAAAEIVVAGWPRTVAPRATARAGNVIGGGDWAGNRLLPDLVRAWVAGAAPQLRRPHGVRPWQHVLEPLRGYLVFAEGLAQRRALPAGLNFGPADGQSISAAALTAYAAAAWRSLGGSLPEPAWTESSASDFEETGVLTLDSSLAAEQLGWVSVLDWQTAVSLTLEWYLGERSGEAPAALVERQLAAYSALVGSAP